jgi:predicted RND superfamily exporter protein
MKTKTQGVDPKLPIQAVVTAVVAVLAYFGINVDAGLAGAIGVVLGLIAGYFAPAPKTVEVPNA